LIEGVLAMMILSRSPGAKANGGAAGSEPPTADPPAPQAQAPADAPSAPAPALAYTEFAAAVKSALRDFHRPDLLARNPLLRQALANPGASAGSRELQAMLTETVTNLFDNPRDEKLRRVIELTYFQPGLKQEAVADRLSLPFGTYRRHLTTALDRLARWLWESARAAPAQLEPVSSEATRGGNAESETATPLGAGESSAPRLSLVVLPLVNIADGTEHDPLVDGITETLTTDLSRRPGVFVISRNTAFTYKGRPTDTRQIGRELGVRYVLEGSVQNAGNRIRINAQLVDAESGAHLWADRFDKPCADLLDLQNEVTARLARNVQIEMVAAESRRVAREHPDRLDSVDHALQGWAAWNEHLSLESARRARRSFEAALELDEHNVCALMGFANAHMWEVNMYGSDDRAGQIRVAQAAALEALSRDPDSADTHLTYGTVLFAMRMPERALREFELAVSLDGNLAAAHGYLGLMKFFLGRAHETRDHVGEAMRLSPRDPLLFHWHFFIGVADLYLHRMVRALESLRKSVEINPTWALSQFILAGGLGLAGLLAEAAEVCAVARRLAPNFTIAKFRAEAVSDNPVYLAQRERMCEGLQMAGVPES
jgi:TolB-like protein